MSTGIIKNSSFTAQNTAITSAYTDGTDGNIMYVNNSSPYFNKIIGWSPSNTALSYIQLKQVYNVLVVMHGLDIGHRIILNFRD